MPKPTLKPILLKRKYLFQDEFDGSQLNPFKWTITDSESKLTQDGAGSLSCAGGKATPAWDDPLMTITRSFASLRGTTLELHLNWSNLGSGGGGMEFGFDSTSPVAGDIAPGYYVTPAGLVKVGVSGSVTTATPVSVTTSTNYLFKVVLKAGGALWYYSTDNGATWYLLWEVSSGFTATQYAGLLSNNAAFTSSYARVYSGSVKPVLVSITQTLTPTTTGTEKVVNGDMELNSTWQTFNAPTSQAQSAAQAHGGTKSWAIVAGGANRGITQGVTLVAGQWYRLTGWVYLNVAAAIAVRTDSNVGKAASSTTTGVWQQLSCTFRSASSAVGGHDISTTSEDANGDWYVDDVSLLQLDFATALGTNQPATKEGIFDCAPATVADNTQCGMVMNWDGNTDPTALNGVFAYVDRNAGLQKVRLDKCVSGTWTSLINASITYSTGTQLRVVRVGTSYAVYYNGVQVGTTQTISDATITAQTGFASFATDSGSSSGTLTCHS